MAERYEAVVIGSGFGGGISACWLSKRWPGGKVMVLERGKRYPMGSFPRSPHDFARNFWNVPEPLLRGATHFASHSTDTLTVYKTSPIVDRQGIDHGKTKRPRSRHS